MDYVASAKITIVIIDHDMSIDKGNCYDQYHSSSFLISGNGQLIDVTINPDATWKDPVGKLPR